MMQPYWVTFADGGKVCVNADGFEYAEDTAMAYADNSSIVTGIQRLPYATDRVHNPMPGVGQYCWRPEVCAGHIACPQRRACTE